MKTPGETIEYLPVSRPAVAAAAAGMLAAVALTTPLLWIIPVLGIVLAVAGLADVARPGAEKAGRGAALLGLALSVGFGTQAVTSTVVSRRITHSRAERVVQAWFDALREGRLEHAESMLAAGVLPPPEFAGPGVSHDHDHDHKPQSPIRAVPTVAAILACGDTAVPEVRCMGTDEEAGEGLSVRVRLAPCDDGRALDLRVAVGASTAKEKSRRVERWSILRIERL